MNYKKEETKAAAVNEAMTATEVERRMNMEVAMPENNEDGMTAEQCVVWRQGEFRQRVRRAVAAWAQEPVESIQGTNTLGELAKGTPWNFGQQARLVQFVNTDQAFSPPFPNTQMRPPSQLLPGSTTVAEWESVAWRHQNPLTPCLAFTD